MPRLNLFFLRILNKVFDLLIKNSGGSGYSTHFTSRIIEGEKLGKSAASSSNIDTIEFRDIMFADSLQFVQRFALQNFQVQRERKRKFFVRLTATVRRRAIVLQCSGLQRPHCKPKSCSGAIANCLEGSR